MPMELTLLTSQKKLVEKQPVDEVFVPGIKGTLDILPGYANFVTLLETGVVRWRTEGGWNSASISKGILEIYNGSISVMADVSEMGSDVDVTRAKDAEVRARRKIEVGGLNQTDYKKQELKLQRSLARQAAADKRQSI